MTTSPRNSLAWDFRLWRVTTSSLDIVALFVVVGVADFQRTDFPRTERNFADLI
jgi:hypothetical protein